MAAILLFVSPTLNCGDLLDAVLLQSQLLYSKFCFLIIDWNLFSWFKNFVTFLFDVSRINFSGF